MVKTILIHRAIIESLFCILGLKIVFPLLFIGDTFINKISDNINSKKANIIILITENSLR